MYQAAVVRLVHRRDRPVGVGLAGRGAAAPGADRPEPGRPEPGRGGRLSDAAELGIAPDPVSSPPLPATPRWPDCWHEATIGK
jgi:hypothetical protein